MEIRFSKSALKALLRSNKAALIRRKIDELGADPLSQGANVKRLTGRPEYRLRVQDWRVIFRLEEGVLWIDDIGPRGAVY
jgi:mRNA interferase RelE/StbE